MSVEISYDSVKVKSLSGRYIILEDIRPVLESFNAGRVSVLGKSVLQQDILLYKVGSGTKRVLLWSQMHGNESTTTKALLDFLSFLETEKATDVLNQFTFYAIPILNPDGAKAYTRTNANHVDLNRDFQKFTQPESTVLNNIFHNIKPAFCYNLHDQRSIFGLGNPPLPATVSFLAPSFNIEREFNDTRIQAVSKILKMVKTLENEIPGQIGRFDDVYNSNCAGDFFQMQNVPTILVEAGHFENDYSRDSTRYFIFMSLRSVFNLSDDNDVVDNELEYYLNIPQNKAVFYDFVYRNVMINYDGIKKITNFAAQLEGSFSDGAFKMIAVISDVDLIEKKGHCEYDSRNKLFQNNSNLQPQVGEIANFTIGDLVFENGKMI